MLCDTYRNIIYRVGCSGGLAAMVRAIALCRNPLKTNMDVQKYGWMGKKIKEPKKRSSKITDIVSYALCVN